MKTAQLLRHEWLALKHTLAKETFQVYLWGKVLFPCFTGDPPLWTDKLICCLHAASPTRACGHEGR